MKKTFYILFLNCFFFFCVQQLHAQQKLQGTVYDYFSKRPLDGVTVQTSKGAHAISDSSGKFMIPVGTKDSVWFTFLTKNTLKYPVDTIRNLFNFEIALYVDAAWLPAIKVRNRNYKEDSLQNRQDYAKAFNFKKPGLKLNTASPSSYTPGAVTVGLNLEELINVFRFRRNRQMLTFQQRLLQQEQDKYINHRFTKYLVTKLTLLKGDKLNSFMAISRPSYDLLLTMNELELGYYIQQCYIIFEKGGHIENIINPKEGY